LDEIINVDKTTDIVFIPFAHHHFIDTDSIGHDCQIEFEDWRCPPYVIGQNDDSLPLGPGGASQVIGNRNRSRRGSQRR